MQKKVHLTKKIPFSYPCRLGKVYTIRKLVLNVTDYLCRFGGLWTTFFQQQPHSQTDEHHYNRHSLLTITIVMGKQSHLSLNSKQNTALYF